MKFRLVALGLLIAGSTLGAQNRPLPDQESFLAETRKHLQTDSTLQNGYVYVETRREQKLDKDGRTREESVKVVESYPGFPGEDRWERLPGNHHGSGCTLASAIAALLAGGMALDGAVRQAQEYTWKSLRAGFSPGHGQAIPDRFFRSR